MDANQIQEERDFRGLMLFFFFDLNAERFEELQVLIVDFEFRIGGKSGNQGSLVGGFLTLFTHADGGFEDQENIIAALFNARDNLGDLFGIRERFVDGFAQFFHQVFELLVHVSPDRGSLKTSNIT